MIAICLHGVGVVRWRVNLVMLSGLLLHPRLPDVVQHRPKPQRYDVSRMLRSQLRALIHEIGFHLQANENGEERDVGAMREDVA